MACRMFEDREHVSQYSYSRPSYNDEVFDSILEFLRQKMNVDGRLPLAVDVGCGTGQQSTFQLGRYFDRVIGVDISPAMIDCAISNNKDISIEFKVSPAEQLPVDDESVYLITAATSYHWFDFDKFFDEVDRVLVPGGVVAAFSWGAFVKVLDHLNKDSLTEILREFTYRSLERGHWRQGNLYIKDKYISPEMQIRYGERVRVDKTQVFEISLQAYLDFVKSTSVVRTMFKEEPEFSSDWWDQTVSRLTNAYGSTDLNSRIKYETELFIIMGRKSVNSG